MQSRKPAVRRSRSQNSGTGVPPVRFRSRRHWSDIGLIEAHGGAREFPVTPALVLVGAYGRNAREFPATPALVLVGGYGRDARATTQSGKFAQVTKTFARGSAKACSRPAEIASRRFSVSSLRHPEISVHAGVPALVVTLH